MLQMFGYLMQRRTEASDASIVFFEEASSLLRRLGLCGPASGIFTPPPAKGPAPTHELPAPAYKLLAAAHRLKLEKIKSASKHTTHQQPEIALTSRRPAPLQRTPPSKPFSISTMSTSAEQLYLTEVLTILRSMDLSDVVKSFLSEENSDNPSFEKRVEFDCTEERELHLEDVHLGPLVVPGPQPYIITDETMDSLTAGTDAKGEEGEEGNTTGVRVGVAGAAAATSDVGVLHRTVTSGKFSTNSGWPSLSGVLFECAQQALHPRVAAIYQARAFAIEQVTH